MFIRNNKIWTAITTWKGKTIVAKFSYLETAIEWAYTTNKTI